MPEEKGLGSKFLGLFVESKDGTPEEGTEAVERLTTTRIAPSWTAPAVTGASSLTSRPWRAASDATASRAA